MRRRRRYATAALLAGPTLALLLALVVWPALVTIGTSFFDRLGQDYVGFANYRSMFALERMRIALRNSLVWIVVFPVATTGVGLALAIASQRMRGRTVFRAIVFLPAALAILSAGIMWRLVYDHAPERGTLNAVIDVAVSSLNPPGSLAGAQPSTASAWFSPDGALVAEASVPAPGPVDIGLVRIPHGADRSPAAREPPLATPGKVVGRLWRDAGARAGEVDPAEQGMLGVRVELHDFAGAPVAATTTGRDGAFVLHGRGPGAYHVIVPAGEFRQPWGGIAWLGPGLVTASSIVAGIWIWTGFAMLLIASGLSQLPADVLDAARVDGASETQVVLRITIPMLKPVIAVVLITLVINAINIFDLIVGIAPGSVQQDANVVSLEMWRTAFTGLGDRGLGSAIAVFMFALTLPIMLLNVHRFRLEGTRDG
jgi:alpha-glucoside transport system permease protein